MAAFSNSFTGSEPRLYALRLLRAFWFAFFFFPSPGKAHWKPRHVTFLSRTEAVCQHWSGLQGKFGWVDAVVKENIPRNPPVPVPPSVTKQHLLCCQNKAVLPNKMGRRSAFSVTYWGFFMILIKWVNTWIKGKLYFQLSVHVLILGFFLYHSSS